MSSSSRQIEVQFEDPNPRKWDHPLKEDVFSAFMSKDNPTVKKIFGLGSFFSPLLFGKFFDPSDAFPLWEFDSEALLPSPRSIDWFLTDNDYVLRAELHGIIIKSVQISVENGKILDVLGLWNPPMESHKTAEWKNGRWWEHGYVRRLELPEKTDWRNIDARWQNESLLEIRIPKSCDVTKQM